MVCKASMPDYGRGGLSSEQGSFFSVYNRFDRRFTCLSVW